MAHAGKIVDKTASTPTAQVIFGWVLSLLLAFAFLAAGGMKLLSKPVMVREFDQIGFGQWFRYFTGVLEIAGAILLLVPKVSRWAVLLLATVMLGAIATHLTILHNSPALAAVDRIIRYAALVPETVDKHNLPPIFV
jgi:uncharacterized membrane protein YphA (DoxX/SURF4 family)